MILLLITAYEVKVNWGLRPNDSPAHYGLRSESEVNWGLRPNDSPAYYFGVKVKRKCLLFGFGYIKGFFV